MPTFNRPIHISALFLFLLVLSVILHLRIGAKPIALADIYTSFWAFDPHNFDHVILWNMRLPRMVTAVCVGAALSVAGALMQGVTRNPLADPGLLSLMSGAACGVILGAPYFEGDIWLPVLAAAGALTAACLVTAIALLAPGGRSAIMLLLSGAAVSAFLKAIISGVNLLNEESFATFRVWLSGAITSDAAQMLPYTAPWLVAGLLVALLSAHQVTVLSMGHEAATGLGTNTAALSLRLLGCTVVLTASSVAMVGPLGFVGLVVPHATRMLVGADYRWIIPCSALLGAVFLLCVDIFARTLLAPAEIATGIVTSLLGAPVFVILVRRLL